MSIANYRILLFFSISISKRDLSRFSAGVGSPGGIKDVVMQLPEHSEGLIFRPSEFSENIPSYGGAPFKTR